MARSVAEGRARRAAELADRPQSGQAGGPRLGADLRMQRAGATAEFGHVAEHQPGFAARLRQGRDRGQHRAGVGVVAVVHQHDAVRQRVRDLPSLHRDGVLESLHDGVEVGARGQRQRPGRQGVEDVVRARKRQPDVGAAGRRVEHETRAVHLVADAAGMQVAAVLHAEAEDPARAGDLREIGREGVVGIDHRDAVVRQRLVDRTLGFGDAEQAAHAFDVRGRDVVHQRHLRRRDAGQVGDIARLAGAHLVDGELRVFRRVDHRQRQADLVVAVARVDVGAAGAREDPVGEHLHRGLAVAAGEGHDHCRAILLHAGGELAERLLGVGAEDARQRGLDVAVQQQGRGAGRFGLRHQGVGVEMLAAQGDEQRAGRQRAGVGADRLDADVRAEVTALDPGGDLRQRDRPHAFDSSKERATARSSKANLRPATSW